MNRSSTPFTAPPASSGTRRWLWPIIGCLGGALTAGAVSLPLAQLPLIGNVTYTEDNALRAHAVVVVALLAAVVAIARQAIAALALHSLTAGLLLASLIEKVKEFQALRADSHAAAGAGEMTRQFAAMSAQTLASVHPRAGAILLPLGCLLGMGAAIAAIVGRPGAPPPRSVPPSNLFRPE